MNKNKFNIRPETPLDYTEIAHVLTAAFEQDAEAKLVEKLRKRKDHLPNLALVAEQSGQLIGYILFSPITIQNNRHEHHPSLALAPVAVLLGRQKQGIGSSLIKQGLSLARQAGFRSVIVLGHAHYYPRFGFKPAAQWNIQSPFSVPDDVFMALELEEGGLKNVEGIVIYPPEFMEM